MMQCPLLNNIQSMLLDLEMVCVEEVAMIQRKE